MLRRVVNRHVQPGHVGVRREHLVWDASGTELRLLHGQRVVARISETEGHWWIGNIIGSMPTHVASPSKWIAQEQVEAAVRRALGSLVAA